MGSEGVIPGREVGVVLKPTNDFLVRNRANASTAYERAETWGKEGRPSEATKIGVILLAGNVSEHLSQCDGVEPGESLGAKVSTTPCEEALVRNVPHYLLLQPSKGAISLAVESRHVDIEDPQQRIRLVFHPRRLSFRGPREPLRDAELPEWLQV